MLPSKIFTVQKSDKRGDILLKRLSLPLSPSRPVCGIMMMMAGIVVFFHSSIRLINSSRNIFEMTIFFTRIWNAGRSNSCFHKRGGPLGWKHINSSFCIENVVFVGYECHNLSVFMFTRLEMCFSDIIKYCIHFTY